MKTKNKKPFLNMDERNKQIPYKVITIMCFLTIIAMQGIVLYRQFALGITFNTTLKDTVGSLGTVFVAVGGLFFAASDNGSLVVSSIV